MSNNGDEHISVPINIMRLILREGYYQRQLLQAQLARVQDSIATFEAAITMGGFHLPTDIPVGPLDADERRALAEWRGRNGY